MTPADRLNEIETKFNKWTLPYYSNSDHEWLINRVKQLTEALEHYKDTEVLVPPQSWNSFKEGRLPAIEEYEMLDIGEVARKALEADE